MTYNVTAEYASQNFDEIIQRADTEAEGVTIVKDNKSFVLIEQKELEALIETAELLQVPEILTDISQARAFYRITLHWRSRFGSKISPRNVWGDYCCLDLRHCDRCFPNWHCWLFSSNSRESLWGDRFLISYSPDCLPRHVFSPQSARE